MTAHKSLLQTSDFIILTTVITASILEWFIPTNLPVNNLLSFTTGIIFLLAEWTIIIVAKLQFKKFGMRTGPGHETTRLLQTGLFSVSRNPIYVGVLLLYPALCFIFNSIWILLIVIPSFILLTYVLIIPEEKYLLEKFGDEYVEYCKKVRRWF